MWDNTELSEEGCTEKGRSFDRSSCLQSQQHGLGQQDNGLVQWLSEGEMGGERGES